MSIEARVEQFFVDAQRPRDSKTDKAIAKLQKFLFRNQEHRFADKEQNYLFQAVQLYTQKYTDGAEEQNPALALLEDALKMPFTVFTTSQKKSMLKMLDKLAGQGPAKQPRDTSQGGQAQLTFEVLDVNDAAVTLMSPDGDTQDVPLSELEEDVRRAIVAGVEAEAPVEVLRTTAGGWQLKA